MSTPHTEDNAMIVDFRAELQLLVAACDKHGWRRNWADENDLLVAAVRARAALSAAPPEPVGEGELTDELLYCMASRFIDSYDTISPGEYEAETECALEVYGSELIAFARAVESAALAAAPPEPVGELVRFPFTVEQLRDQWNAQADEFNQWESLGLDEQIGWAQARAAARAALSAALPEPVGEGEMLTDEELKAAYWEAFHGSAMCGAEASWLAGLRAVAIAADRQRRVVPIAVRERLPGPGDCDAEGKCWWFLPAQQLEILRQSDAWSFRKHIPRKDDYCRWTHWLPAHALPLPQPADAGEVGP